MIPLLRKLFRRPSQSDVLNVAQQLFEAGQIHESIEHLTSANRRKHSAAIEMRLMELRHRGFYRLSHPATQRGWPPETPASPFASGVIPSVSKRELSASTLAQGIFCHGALIVRGLLLPPQISAMVETIDRAYEAFDTGLKGNRSEEMQSWYMPLQPCVEEEQLTVTRKWVRNKGGGVWAVDSPRGFFNLLETLEQCGVMPTLSDYLGERPALSMKKTTLRRVSPHCNPDWHQDGAFLGQDIRTVNLWIALTDCGVDAPSMDMVPIRLPGIVPTGKDGTQFSWSTDEASALHAAGSTPPVRLHFKAGDAILFDERNMHRTAVDPGMTRDRHAIEAWFFAPSCYPMDQVPILC